MFKFAFVSSLPHTGKKFTTDQFTSSEFFTDEVTGFELRDYSVFAKSQADPVLRDKVKEYLIENDVKNANADLDDDQVFGQIVSKYDSTTSILQRVKNRIAELRSKPVDTPSVQDEK